LAIILLVLLGPFVFVFSFLGKLNGGNLIYKACNIYARVWFFMAGILYKEINKPKFNKGSQYIFITINQPIRALGKQQMAKYPIFGYFYKKAVVSVDRDNATMRAQSIAVLKNYIAQKISIFIFPEGTFNESGKPLKPFYDGAFRIAIDTQTPIQPILFLDNNKRMDNSGSFNLTPGKCRVFFLAEIFVDGFTKKDVTTLKQQVFNAMEKGLIENGFKN
jgi:1-acyl-sn-glycerol-3-phosphate acyltransferase